MSQFQFQPPPLNTLPPQDVTRPARHAALLMNILGLLVLLFGGMCTLVGSVPYDQFPPEVREQLDHVHASANVDPLPALYKTGIALLVWGGLYFVVGFFVRGGWRAAIGLAIALTGVGLISCLSGLVGAFQALGSGDPAGVVPMVFSGGLCAIFSLQMVWLVQARRAGAMVAAGEWTPMAADPPIPPPPSFQDVIPPPPPPVN